MNNINEVTILGRGALGVMYGAFFLSKGIKTVYLVDEARKSRYQRQQVSVNGIPVDFVYKTPQEITNPLEFLLVSLKGVSLDACKMAHPIVDSSTAILSVLNGISSEEIISSYLPEAQVIHCVAQRMDALWKNNCLTYKDFGELCLGLTPLTRSNAPALKRVSNLFQSIDFPFVIEKDILHRMWCKWMLNVGVNQTLMLYNDTFSRVHQRGEARDFMIGTMREVLELSRYEGVALTEQDFIDYLQIIDELNPNGMPSMRQDRLAKRKSELELFAGTVIKKAAPHGLKVPYNEKIYSEVKKIESSY